MILIRTRCFLEIVVGRLPSLGQRSGSIHHSALLLQTQGKSRRQSPLRADRDRVSWAWLKLDDLLRKRCEDLARKRLLRSASGEQRRRAAAGALALGLPLLEASS